MRLVLVNNAYNNTFTTGSELYSCFISNLVVWLVALLDNGRGEVAESNAKIKKMTRDNDLLFLGRCRMPLYPIALPGQVRHASFG